MVSAQGVCVETSDGFRGAERRKSVGVVLEVGFIEEQVCELGEVVFPALDCREGVAALAFDFFAIEGGLEKQFREEFERRVERLDGAFQRGPEAVAAREAVDIGGQVSFEDDGPDVISIVDAIIVNQPVQVVNGTYDADFGADGLDFLTLALGDAAFGFSYTQTGDPTTQAQVDVTVTGGTDFTFFYTTTTEPDGSAEMMTPRAPMFFASLRRATDVSMSTPGIW